MSLVRKIGRVVGSFGVDARAAARSLIHIPQFLRDMRAYRRAAGRDTEFPLRFTDLYPCLADYTDNSGVAKGHYFHQDLLVASKIYGRRPARHVDIGSRMDGFIAHLLAFMPVESIDIRDLESIIPGLTFIRSDATDLAEIPSESLESVSTLHAAEHFGLGRYGDPIDPGSCFRFMMSLQRVLAPGGRLYFAVPVGRQRLEFNAHRVFAPQTILKAFAGLELVAFDAVLDDGNLYRSASIESAAAANYACGIFEFTKKA